MSICRVMQIKNPEQISSQVEWLTGLVTNGIGFSARGIQGELGLLDVIKTGMLLLPSSFGREINLEKLKDSFISSTHIIERMPQG